MQRNNPVITNDEEALKVLYSLRAMCISVAWDEYAVAVAYAIDHILKHKEETND